MNFFLSIEKPFLIISIKKESKPVVSLLDPNFLPISLPFFNSWYCAKANLGSRKSNHFPKFSKVEFGSKFLIVFSNTSFSFRLTCLARAGLGNAKIIIRQSDIKYQIL